MLWQTPSVSSVNVVIDDVAATRASSFLVSSVSSSLLITTLPFIDTTTLEATTALASFSLLATTFVQPGYAMPNGSLAPPADPVDTGECKLLGPFAVIVQASLGLLALVSLVFKRYRERPQRPIKIWAFDASKQVFGSALLHLLNLLLSMLSAGEIQNSLINAAANSVNIATNDSNSPNPCSFYLLNLAIDTTVGIPILIIILRLVHAGASLTPFAEPPESIHSGNYGQPPKASWWLKQSLLYFIGLLGMKACVFLIFTLCPWIIVVGNWALRWTEGNEALQIAFVMLIFPLIMNALQYYIIDGFIKNNKPTLVEDGVDRGHGDDEVDGLLNSEEVADAAQIDEANETRPDTTIAI